MVLTILSDYSGNHTKLSKILLNGNNICMVRNSLTGHLNQGADVQKLIPGGEGPTASG
jgi:U6 snRNA-associated Sm-like protein LSm5